MLNIQNQWLSPAHMVYIRITGLSAKHVKQMYEPECFRMNVFATYFHKTF